MCFVAPLSKTIHRLLMGDFVFGLDLISIGSFFVTVATTLHSTSCLSATSPSKNRRRCPSLHPTVLRRPPPLEPRPLSPYHCFLWERRCSLVLILSWVCHAMDNFFLYVQVSRNDSTSGASASRICPLHQWQPCIVLHRHCLRRLLRLHWPRTPQLLSLRL